jgi:isopenicillin-N epimerase
MDANPMRFFAFDLEERIAHVRRHIAAFLGADPEGSALVDNATTGMAVVFNSLDLKPGDEIVTTSHGYGGVNVAVRDACRRTGALSRVVALPLAPEDGDVVRGVRAACSARTKLIIVDSITSPTARLLPAGRIAQVGREVGAAVLVDAAHAPGQLATPVGDIDADFWVGNLHKWAFAPRGTALLVVAPRWRDRIRPLVVSWEHEKGFPANVEFQGTRDCTSWLAGPSALFTLRTLGAERVREHNARLAAFGQHLVATAIGTTPPPERSTLAMRVVPLPKGVATTLEAAIALRRRISDELSTELAIGPWEGRGLMRLSAQVYNRPEEYERLAAGLPKLLG